MTLWFQGSEGNKKLVPNYEMFLEDYYTTVVADLYLIQKIKSSFELHLFFFHFSGGTMEKLCLRATFENFTYWPGWRRAAVVFTALDQRCKPSRYFQFQLGLIQRDFFKSVKLTQLRLTNKSSM